MTNKPMINKITEIVMATQDKRKSAVMRFMMKAGLLRKIAPKVYTTNMEDIIRRNIFFILGSSILRQLLVTDQLLNLSRLLKGTSI